MTIRPFIEADRPAVHSIIIECFEPVALSAIAQRKYGLLGGKSWQERKTAEVDADILAHPAGAFVVEDNGEIVGFITTALDENSRVGHIRNLAVSPARQGQGLGKQLIEHALDYLRRSGMTHARIETLATNEVGQHLYPKLGFEELTRQIFYMRKL
ncbi:MAG: GNAT family N-acetyltransferase [Candidatus Zipacnadales bacterium]